MVLHSPNHFIPLVWFCLTLTAATVGVFFFTGYTWLRFSYGLGYSYITLIYKAVTLVYGSLQVLYITLI